jgi:hypothetical protein
MNARDSGFQCLHAIGLMLLLVLTAACTTRRQPTLSQTAATAAQAATQSQAQPATQAGQGRAAAQPIPTSAATSTAATAIVVPARGEPIFTVAVLVDTRSQQVTREQAQAVINEAGMQLRALVPVIMVMTDFVEDGGGGSTTEMLQRYMIAHTTALPNGVVIFSFGDGGRAKLNGGYGYTAPAPAGYRNPFVSPLVGNNHIYVAVVDYGFKYMACGYGGSDSVKSATALSGECSDQPGTACVQQNGYSMCASAIGHLYMSTPTYFVSSTIVHALLQPFAPGGAQDDYSTPQCTARMGYPAGFHDLQESQYHIDLCPFVYDDFLKSYQP